MGEINTFWNENLAGITEKEFRDITNNDHPLKTEQEESLFRIIH